MKRVFAFVVAALMIAALTIGYQPVSAQITRLNEDRSIETYTIVNSSATNTISTAISTSTIIPGKNRLVAYEICPTETAAEVVIALYDSATVGGASSTYLFAESEARSNESKREYFLYPKDLANGLVVAQGPKTIATIFYERYRP